MAKDNLGHKATHGEGRGRQKGESLGSREDRMDGKGEITSDSLKHYGSELRGPKETDKEGK